MNAHVQILIANVVVGCAESHSCGQQQHNVQLTEQTELAVEWVIILSLVAGFLTMSKFPAQELSCWAATISVRTEGSPYGCAGHKFQDSPVCLAAHLFMPRIFQHTPPT